MRNSIPNDWYKKAVGISIAVLLTWLSWISLAVVQLVAADTRDVALQQQVFVDRGTLSGLVTQVAVMDVKMNLLLLSNGITIPQEAPVTKKE